MRTLFVSLAVGLALVPIAAAAETDRVQVGGSSNTPGFSRQTYVGATTPDAYTKIDFDGDAGNWRGPLCFAPSYPSLSGDVHIAWGVGFSKEDRSAEEAADRGRTFRDMETAQRGTIEVPHVIRATKVGEILAHFIIGQSSDEDSTGWAEIGVGIPMTRGVFTRARFWSTGPSAATCTVASMPSRLWHRDAVLAAARGLAIDGNLPAARVTAHAQRRRVAGFVSDGFGHPVVGVRVRLERRVGRGWRRAGAATTNASGFYSALSLPGLVRAAHGSIRTRAVRVR
jgi:hypothetical protein